MDARWRGPSAKLAAVHKLRSQYCEHGRGNWRGIAGFWAGIVMVARPWPSRSLDGTRGDSSDRDVGIEFVDPALKGCFGQWLEVIGMCADDVEGLTVVVSRPFGVAASLVDHAETLEAVREVREARMKIAGCRLRLIEGASI